MLEGGSVGGTRVLIEPVLRARRPVLAVRLERREPGFVRHRPRSELVPFDEKRAGASTERSVSPFGEQDRQGQR